MIEFFQKLRKTRLVGYSLFVTIVYAIVILTLLYTHFPINDKIDLAKVVIHWVLLSASSYMIISVLAFNKYINSILLPVFFILSAFGSYFSYQFDMIFNEALLESVFETNIHESLDLVSFELIVYLLVIISLSIWLVRIRFSNSSSGLNFGYFFLLLSSFFIFNSVNAKRNNTLFQKVPFSYYHAYQNLLENEEELSVVRKDISQGAVSNSDSLIVIIVIGEAQRSDHVGANGYYRNTMPLVEKRGSIFFPNIYSEWTHTNKSLPLILTRADSTDYSISYKEKSFISIFDNCGFSTSWLGNQIPGSTYKPFIEENKYIYINRPELSVYSNTKKLDTDLLPIIEKRIEGLSSKKLIVVHQIGSHWWYNSHYPDTLSFYKPTLVGKNFTDKYIKEYINSYDNTIRYTDIFVDNIISKIQNKNSVLIYLSDHGESMGENGKWLHANEVDEERNPACFVWLSDEYKSQFPEKFEKLKVNRLKRFRTDFLFHSALDVSDISSEYLVEKLSLFW